MAIALIPVMATLSTSSSIIYTCPVGKSAIAFDGTLANKDSTLKKGQQATVELQKSTGEIYTLVKDVLIPYGISIRIPKYTLSAGDRLLMKATNNSLVDVVLSVAEKS